MPVTSDVEGGILVLRMVGVYEPQEIESVLAAALEALGGTVVSGLLFDVRASESLRDRPTPVVRGVARFLARNGRSFGSRLALLATADYAYGLMRMGSVILEEEGMAASVFRDEAEARDWLRS